MKNSMIFWLWALTLFACEDDSASSIGSDASFQDASSAQDANALADAAPSSDTAVLTDMGTIDAAVVVDPGFDDLCRLSGGTATPEHDCVCGRTVCDKGVVCNYVTKICANIIAAECDAETPARCVDNGFGIGIVTDCQNGHLFQWSCNNVSCNETEDGCGECVNSDATICEDSASFLGQETRCVKGKKIKEACSQNSCNGNECGSCLNYSHICLNDADQIGQVKECQGGRNGETITNCLDVSCRSDLPTCGECKNGTLRCEEDNNNDAIMYRCVGGRWERIQNRFDPFDPSYACPSHCRLQARVEELDQCKRDVEENPDLCLSCDPCSGQPDQGYDDYNPCYDEARCAEVLAEEDPKYPPFRDYDTAERLGDRRTMKEVYGYDFNDHRPGTTTDDRTHDFWLDLTNGRQHVSCNADGTDYGRCHNSLQICINRQYHGYGYIVQCSHGALSDYDENGDGIACHCEDTGRNANGCCYTRRNCFKNSSDIAGEALCKKPGSSEGYAEDNPDYQD